MKKITTALLAAMLAMALGLSPAASADSYDAHLFMADKNAGTCKALTGTVEMVVVLVSLPGAPWDSASAGQMNQTLQEAAAMLTQEAAAYGAQLSIVQHVHHARAETAASINGSEDWAAGVLSGAASLQDRSSAFYREKPILFCLNTDGRSFAQSEYADTQAEYAVIFGCSDAGTVRHELLHLYGAWDYYLLDAFTQAAEAAWPDSIMLSSEADHRTDSLTAYIVGWTDKPDEEARAFLSATGHITREVYNQALEENKVTGWATLETNQGLYTGQLADGSRHGWGEMHRANGDVCSGLWVWGTMHGLGTYTWADGSVYTGDFLDGQRTGKGTMTWPDGSAYTGDFLNGQRTGKGTCTWPDGNVYTGDFLDGQRTGKGVYTWPDGSVYTGDFLDGHRTGMGTMTWPDGSAYTGGFADDSCSGKGIYTWPNGDVYAGDFVDGYRTGKGSYTWADGDVYTGDFVNGQRTGKGTMTWAGGDVYTGDFTEGYRTGKGVYVWADGSVYTGSFVDNLRHGSGTYVGTDGTILDGEWDSGSLVR